ncbi:hypothetical protein CAEBREN_21397 [Caenorhabditis brenneri]|uniref:Uncharacterized protein n=1 Tax=Caenorhabditis brenneri TaxID=135651 RepID=G0NGD5_CAEBE|nr:hypothetical protein CAEBREN_21397 [Caenorhabditis brenneri]
MFRRWTIVFTIFFATVAMNVYHFYQNPELLRGMFQKMEEEEVNKTEETDESTRKKLSSMFPLITVMLSGFPLVCASFTVVIILTNRFKRRFQRNARPEEERLLEE